MVKFDINNVPRPPKSGKLSQFLGLGAFLFIAIVSIALLATPTVAYPSNNFYFQSPYAPTLLAYNPHYAYAIHEYDEYFDPYRGYSAGPPKPTFGGCFISTGKGLLEDSDCDKVPNVEDNCPYVANAQSDQTNNGLGDACDLIIQEIDSRSSVFLQGRAIVPDVRIINNRDYDMNTLRLSLDIPSLGVIAYEELSTLKHGEARTEQIFARIPQCAQPGVHEVFITADYTFPTGQRETITQNITIAVEQSQDCPVDQGLGNTYIDILEIQDVHKTKGAIYPFTIENVDKFDQSYILSIEGEEQWGESQLNPGTVIVVPAGQSKEGSIHIWMNEDVSTQQGFFLVISNKEGIAQQALIAKPAPEERTHFSFAFLTFILSIILIAIIAAGITLLVKVQKGTTTLK